MIAPPDEPESPPRPTRITLPDRTIRCGDVALPVERCVDGLYTCANITVTLDADETLPGVVDLFVVTKRGPGEATLYDRCRVVGRCGSVWTLAVFKVWHRAKGGPWKSLAPMAETPPAT